MHRIDTTQDQVTCYAPPGSTCRRQPLCDTATWIDHHCDDHTPPHQVVDGQRCWMIQWINAPSLDECAEEYVAVTDGSTVTLTFHGADIGVTWRQIR